MNMQISTRTVRRFGIVIALVLSSMMTAACAELTGAAVGAGGGAAVSAATGHKPSTGALIGAGIGAAAGGIYDLAH